MFSWIRMAVLLYISYYTVMYAIMVWKRERNLLACIFIIILAVSILIVPVFKNVNILY